MTFGSPPVVLAALAPPEEPQIIFYRGQAADTTVTQDEVPADDVRRCRVLWIAGALALGATASRPSHGWSP